MNQQGSMSKAEFAVRRSVLGMCSVGLLVAAALLWLANRESVTPPLVHVLVRMGLVLATIWLALPELRPLFKYFSVTGILVLLGVIVLFAISPRSAAPLAVLGMFLLVFCGINRAWQWLWEPLPVATRSKSEKPKLPAANKTGPGDGDSKGQGKKERA